MNQIMRRAVATEIFLTAYVAGMIERHRNDDRGQASTEYAGILFVVVALVAAVALAVKGGAATAISDKIKQAIDSIGGE